MGIVKYAEREYTAFMNLQTFLTKTGQNQSEFAAILGVRPSTICRILNGTRAPSLDLIHEIRSATSMAVTADDLLDSVFGPPSFPNGENNARGAIVNRINPPRRSPMMSGRKAG